MVSEFQSCFRVFNTLKYTAARTCEIKRCRQCSCEITVILFQFYFTCASHCIFQCVKNPETTLKR